VNLDRGALAALPAPLRAELAESLLSLDATRISGAIRHVSDSNPALGAVLDRHATRLQYTTILNALRSGGDGNGPGKDQGTVLQVAPTL
jgi:hypothetical protein